MIGISFDSSLLLVVSLVPLVPLTQATVRAVPRMRTMIWRTYVSFLSIYLSDPARRSFVFTST